MIDEAKTTPEQAIRALFDAGWAVSDVAKKRLYTVPEIIRVRQEWLHARAEKIGSLVAPRFHNHER